MNGNYFALYVYTVVYGRGLCLQVMQKLVKLVRRFVPVYPFHATLTISGSKWIICFPLSCIVGVVWAYARRVLWTWPFPFEHIVDSCKGHHFPICLFYCCCQVIISLLLFLYRLVILAMTSAQCWISRRICIMIFLALIYWRDFVPWFLALCGILLWSL